MLQPDPPAGERAFTTYEEAADAARAEYEAFREALPDRARAIASALSEDLPDGLQLEWGIWLLGPAEPCGR